MLTVEELGLEIAELAARLDVATHRLLTCIRQFDETNGWCAQGAVSCAHWLSWRIGLDLATAREKVRVARALGVLPTIDAALAAGQLSYAKVRALSRVATANNEATLLDLALYATGAQLERLCRGYRTVLAADEAPSPEARSLRRRTLPGGMVKLEIVLCPDEAELVFQALDCAREVGHAASGDSAHGRACGCGPERGHGRSHDLDCDDDDVSAEGSSGSASGGWPSRADGVVALAEAFLAGSAGTGNGGERFQVMIHVDQDTLAVDGAQAVDGRPATSQATLQATLDDGTRVSAETFRRVACDCGLLAHGGRDEHSTLSVGRRSRSIPPAIRRALRLRDRGCRFPGCTHNRFLHGHHVRHWLHGGETSVDNLVLLCTRHHHLVHEGGWTVVREDGRDGGDWAFVAPDGERLPAEHRHAVNGDTLAWLQDWAEERGLDLGPDANLPLWDGTRMDYDVAVAGLLAQG
jgi:hypothetical protein